MTNLRYARAVQLTLTRGSTALRKRDRVGRTTVSRLLAGDASIHSKNALSQCPHWSQNRAWTALQTTATLRLLLQLSCLLQFGRSLMQIDLCVCHVRLNVVDHFPLQKATSTESFIKIH